jgi:hypothetical protein
MKFLSLIQWGTVPSWFTVGSLLLALRIVLRDRKSSERAQVHSLGIWSEIDGTPSLPGGTRNDQIMFRFLFKNSSELPLEVAQVAWSFNTVWGIREPDLVACDNHEVKASIEVRRYVPGKKDTRRYLTEMQIPPGQEKPTSWWPIILAETAPEDDAILSFLSGGIKEVIDYMLVIDNSGRRWKVRPRKSKPAKRIRWYSWSLPNYPPEWQNPIWRRMRTSKAKAKALVKKARKQIENKRRDRPDAVSDAK